MKISHRRFALLALTTAVSAAALAVSAVAALIGFPEPREGRQPPALAFLALLLAVQLLVYTEGGSLFGTPWAEQMQMGATE